MSKSQRHSVEMSHIAISFKYAVFSRWLDGVCIRLSLFKIITCLLEILRQNTNCAVLSWDIGTSRLSQRKERRFGTQSEERGAVANRAVHANREGINFQCPNRSHSERERQPL